MTDEFWISAMQEELGQFIRNEVWDLVPRPKGMNVIGTKWIYKNKSDEKGIVTRNKLKGSILMRPLPLLLALSQ